MLSARRYIQTTKAVSIVTIFLLILAALGLVPNYLFARALISLGFLSLCVLSAYQGYREASLIFLLSTLLFQPFILAYLPRSIWILMDILLAVVTGLFWYWTTNSYWKGGLFEQYVSNLLPEPLFTIVDRTRATPVLARRRVESDRHPDFVFRNTRTNELFAVECKWRKRWDRNPQGVEGLSWSVVSANRYRAFGEERHIPVYVAFGIGGIPEQPKEVHFVPIEKLGRSFLFQGVIRGSLSLNELIRIVG